MTTSHLILPPLLPGQGTLVVVGTNAAGEEEDLLSVPMTVRQESWGALRTGIGFGYTEQLTTSFATREGVIVPNGGGPFSVDLVVGISAFLRGRDQRYSRAIEDDFGEFFLDHFGIYAGVGIVSAESTGVEAVTSVHVGLEGEVSPELSIVFAFVLRRGVSLAQNLMEGDAFTEASVPTRFAVAPGFGITLNFTPEVFQFGVR